MGLFKKAPYVVKDYTEDDYPIVDTVQMHMKNNGVILGMNLNDSVIDSGMVVSIGSLASEHTLGLTVKEIEKIEIKDDIVEQTDDHIEEVSIEPVIGDTIEEQITSERIINE